MKINFTSGQNFQFPKTHKTFLRGGFFEEAYFLELKILLLDDIILLTENNFLPRLIKKGKLNFSALYPPKYFRLDYPQCKNTSKESRESTNYVINHTIDCNR